MANRKTHFAVKHLANHKVKTACGRTVLAKNATGTYKYVTCEKCKQAMRKTWG